MIPRLISVFALLASLWLASPCAQAQCNGPTGCCVTEPVAATPRPTPVRLGLRVMRLRSLNEQAGTYEAELTVLMRWPVGGLRPNPRPRNAGESFTVVLDETRQAGETCFREERIQGAFQTWFRLRRFPFDEQLLRLNLEDREQPPEALRYEPTLWPNTISIDAFRELSGWRFEGYATMTVKRSSFAFPNRTEHPQLLIVNVPVARLWQFYLSRYFFPLFLIVALAYGLFWVRPEDLSSSASIGVTCLLAIIAFQITQASTLPQVSYLTIADLVYMVCYIATALALALTVYEAYLCGNDRKADADALDRRWRWLFPLLFFLSIGAAVLGGWRAHGDPTRDIPHLLPPATPPPGEPAVV